jgi:hypothetical protein
MLPSLTISKPMLKELCNILDKQYAKKKIGVYMDETCYVKYQFKGGAYDIIRNSAPALQDLSIKDIRSIFLEFSCNEELIAIRINLKRSYLSEFRVIGKDPTWVDETAKNIDKVLKTCMTRNDLFHKHWKRALPIYLILAATICYFLDVLIYYNLQSTDQTRNFYVNYVVLFIALVGPLMLCWHELFQWLYPKFQVESLRRMTFRLWIPVSIFAFLAGITSAIQIIKPLM